MIQTMLPVRADDSAVLMAVIEKAAASNEFDIDRLQKLLELKERWDANEARRLFIGAMLEFKKAPPAILKNRQVRFTTDRGVTEYKHATHDEVTFKVGDALAKHGLTHSWSMTQGEGRIAVDCVLTHVRGHSERVTLVADYDKSGGKNSIQAVASANSYLQRYTLLAVTGLSTADMPDDDGAHVEKTAPAVNADVWLHLQDAATRGTMELSIAWKELENDTRHVIVTHHGAKWQLMKDTAASVPHETIKR